MYRYGVSQTFIAADSESAMSSMSKAYFNSQKLYNIRVTIYIKIEMCFDTSFLRENRFVTERAVEDKVRYKTKAQMRSFINHARKMQLCNNSQLRPLNCCTDE